MTTRRRTATGPAGPARAKARAAETRGRRRALQSAISSAARALHATRRALVTCHISPDGDAVGSCLALALALRARGARVTVWSEDPVPYNYRFLPGAATVVQTLPPGASFDHTYILDLSEHHHLLVSAGRGIIGDNRFQAYAAYQLTL